MQGQVVEANNCTTVIGKVKYSSARQTTYVACPSPIDNYAAAIDG
ncbi:MAG: hypothetical protein AAFR62_07910 [Cyanobacteria bacterium J06629_2]